MLGNCADANLPRTIVYYYNLPNKPSRGSASGLISKKYMDIANIIGWCASICLVFGYLPQAFVTIRTRETSGIALPTFIMMGLGSFLFALQGAVIGNWPLIVTNGITFICSVIIFSIKIYNDYFRSKKR